MKCKTIIAALCALGLAGAALAQNPVPEKTWLGEFRIDGKATGIILHDRSGAKGAPSVIDVPALGAREVALSGFAMTASRSRFELKGGPEAISFEGKRGKGQIAGRVAQGQSAGTFKLVRIEPTTQAMARKYAGSYQIAPGHVIDIGPMDEAGGLLVFIDQKTRREGPLYRLTANKFVSGPTIGIPYPFVVHVRFITDARGDVKGLRWRDGKRELSARKIAPHRIEEVSVVNGGVTLKGTLSVPLARGPHPAIVLAHGSGDATHNVGVWNAFFARLGFAVLSLDKRGAGKSTGDWHTAGIEDIAGDWLAGVAMLKQRADIDPRRIGVHGSSQGGWTGPLMAERSNDVNFVIVRAGSATSVGDTMAHEVAWSVREAGFGEAEAKEADAAARHLFELAGASWEEFSAAVASYKDKPWANAAWPLNMSKDGWGRGWVARNAPFEPTATLSKVKVPMLWFLGTLDHNVPSAATAERLERARKASGNNDITVVMLPNAGHGFMETRTGNNTEFVNQTHMIDGYWNKMESWLQGRVLSKK